MLFVNARGEVLLQLRDNVPTIRFPNHWGAVGGGIEPGESPELALRREVMEEVGETLTEFLPCGVYPASSLIYAYTARLDVVAESMRITEGQRVQFFDPRQALRQNLVPWLYDALPSLVRSDAFARLLATPAPPRHVLADATSVVFINPRGELLLRLRDDKPGLPFRAMWDLIGGSLEPGESHADAIVRETREELGFDLNGHTYWRMIQGLMAIHIYLAPLAASSESLTLMEGQRVEWFSPDAASRLDLVPYMQRLLPLRGASDEYRRIIANPADAGY